MTNRSLSSIAEEYLYSINPLAQRIGEDVTATKEAYEGLWNALSTAEKNQAIDETIIQPEVALKYTHLKNVECRKDLPDSYPKLRIHTGLKYVIDETGSTLRWRDEHSGPFSFLTQSQMNLNLSDGSESPDGKNCGSEYQADSSRFTSPRVEDSSVESFLDDYGTPSDRLNFYQSDSYSDGVFKNSDTANLLNTCSSNDNTAGSIFTKLINKTSLLKMTNNVSSVDDDTEILVSHKHTARVTQKNGISNRNQMNCSSLPKSGDINESTALLDTSSSYSSFQSSQTIQEDAAIPKTGFEFLDNW
ncbi:uncharacterized protein C1orf198 homolog [Venturia canescens]|uniref:uncharacterized protein C1orf198 homolog n=1 Tax=Venturia canescens TaxID=32260 RepID=UPI001C9C5AED|nr:uncharacterized protein C1orf198 homolog [Venturia canescens]